MLASLISLYIAAQMPPQIMTSSEVLSSQFDLLNLIQEKAETPNKNSKYISPIIGARSSIALDMNTGKILYEKNAYERLPIASITKLMTTYIILKENKLNDVVTVSNNAATVEGSTMYLRAGETIAVENLLYGALINSANDAAVALAEYNAGSVDEFVEKMNKEALLLGLTDTHFSNPIGLDQADNYSSSYDIAKLSKYIYQNQFIKHAAKLKELEVKSVSGDYTHKLESTNELLDNEYLNIKGLKTGRTSSAGLCLVSIAENESSNEIITVVLDSPERFNETKILVDWVFRAYNW